MVCLGQLLLWRDDHAPGSDQPRSPQLIILPIIMLPHTILFLFIEVSWKLSSSSQSSFLWPSPKGEVWLSVTATVSQVKTMLFGMGMATELMEMTTTLEKATETRSSETWTNFSSRAIWEFKEADTGTRKTVRKIKKNILIQKEIIITTEWSHHYHFKCCALSLFLWLFIHRVELS